MHFIQYKPGNYLQSNEKDLTLKAAEAARLLVGLVQVSFQTIQLALGPSIVDPCWYPVHDHLLSV